MLRSTLLAILLSGCAAALLTPHVPVLIVLIGAVALAIAWAVRFGPPHTLPLFAGIFAISAAGIVVGATLRYDLLAPAAATPLSVREAALQPARGAFRFHDAVVRADYAVSERITNQRGATINTIHVAPLVPADWTPAEPITFWVVAEASRRNIGAAQWATAHNAALRVGGFQLPLYRQAAERAAAFHGLPSAPDAVFVHWLADPAAELAAARRRVALQIAGVIAVWLLAIAGWRSFARQVRYTL